MVRAPKKFGNHWVKVIYKNPARRCTKYLIIIPKLKPVSVELPQLQPLPQSQPLLPQPRPNPLAEAIEREIELANETERLAENARDAAKKTLEAAKAVESAITNGDRDEAIRLAEIAKQNANVAKDAIEKSKQSLKNAKKKNRTERGIETANKAEAVVVEVDTLVNEAIDAATKVQAAASEVKTPSAASSSSVSPFVLPSTPSTASSSP